MDFLFTDALGKPLWMWGVFFLLVVALLAFDLGILHRKPREISMRESVWLSVFYITAGLLFALWVNALMGREAMVNYLTGFVVEKSLAMDNIFVIAMIFAYFGIPRQYQHRVLVWGIIGVVVLRGIMIGFGAAIVHEFEWVLYLFAVFLIYTGIRMMRGGDEEYDVASNPVLIFARKHLRLSKELHGNAFFIRQIDQKTGTAPLHATPLFLALITVEVADVIFAVDSIPAVFTITTDPYIVYTSNIFAILGLRALYFLLSAMIARFSLMHYALAAVLVFIGGKIFITDLLGLISITPVMSLVITLAILSAGIIASLRVTSERY